MKNFMYSIVAAALLLFAIWAAPPPASANGPTTGSDSMNVEHEQTDTAYAANVGIEKVVAESAAEYTQHAQCIDQAESEVFRGACPIGAHSQPVKGGERTSEHLILYAVYYDEDLTMSAPGFARHDLVLRC